MLNHRVHAELEFEFLGEIKPDSLQNELHCGLLKESFDALKSTSEKDFEDLSDSELAAIESECAELRDEASNAVSHLRALRRIRQAERNKGFANNKQ